MLDLPGDNSRGVVEESLDEPTSSENAAGVKLVHLLVAYQCNKWTSDCQLQEFYCVHNFVSSLALYAVQ